MKTSPEKLTPSDMKGVAEDAGRSGAENFITCPDGVKMGCPDGQTLNSYSFSIEIVGNYPEVIGFTCEKPRDPNDSGTIELINVLCPGFKVTDIGEHSGSDSSGLIPPAQNTACNGKKPKNGCVYTDKDTKKPTFGHCEKLNPYDDQLTCVPSTFSKL